MQRDSDRGTAEWHRGNKAEAGGHKTPADLGLNPISSSQEPGGLGPVT